MDYKAVVRFADLQDGKHIYEVGDMFPRPGLNVTAARLSELSGRDNRFGQPLIEAAETPEKDDSSADKETIKEASKTRKKAVSERLRG